MCVRSLGPLSKGSRRCLLSVALGLASIAQAKPDAPRPVLEEIEASLKRARTELSSSQIKSIARLDRALKSLVEEDFAQVHQILEGSVHPLYADYRLGILAEALRGEAAHSLDQDQFKTAGTQANRAASLSRTLAAQTARSPYYKTNSSDIVQAEALAAEAALRGGETSGPELFGRVLARSSVRELSATMRPQLMTAYVSACRKKWSLECPATLAQFLKKLSAQNAHVLAINTAFPQLRTQLGSDPLRGAGTLSYKAPDFDQVAFDTAWRGTMEALSPTPAMAEGSPAPELWRQFLESYPRSTHRQRARYWLGLLTASPERPPNAAWREILAEMPLSYYGLLAQESLTPSGPSFVPPEGDERLPLARSTDPLLSPGELFHLRRAEGFLAARASQLALTELKLVSSLASLNSPFLVYLAGLQQRAGAYRASFPVITELLQRQAEGMTGRLAREWIFPQAFGTEITQAATQSGLSPLLLRAVVKQESGMDPLAASSANALGLSQILLSTAQGIDPSITRKELLTNPTKNLTLGAKYLRDLLGRFANNRVWALAAYNAGPTAARSWMKASSTRDYRVAIENIPYRETREYVAGVLRNVVFYSMAEPTPMHLRDLLQDFDPAVVPSPAPTDTDLPPEVETD